MPEPNVPPAGSATPGTQASAVPVPAAPQDPAVQDPGFRWDGLSFSPSDVIENIDEEGTQLPWEEAQKILAEEMKRRKSGSQAPAPAAAAGDQNLDPQDDDGPPANDPRVEALLEAQYSNTFNVLKDKYPLVDKEVLRAKLRTLPKANFDSVEPMMKLIQKQNFNFLAKNQDTYVKLKESQGNDGLPAENGITNAPAKPPTQPKNEPVDIFNHKALIAATEKFFSDKGR